MIASETVGQGLARALILWQAAAGPYWPFVNAAPFVSGQVAGPTIKRRTRVPWWLREVVTSRATPGITRRAAVAYFVDVSPMRVLPAAPWLNRRGFIVVPVIQRWAVQRGVLRSERLLAQLVEVGECVQPPVGDRGVIFILDGDRGGQSPVRAAPRRFDNRYAYPICRFPSADFLLTHGIRDVCWLFVGSFADDLKPYREILERRGILSTEEALCVG